MSETSTSKRSSYVTPTSRSPLQEALLIKAQSRVVELESEVCRLRQEVAASKVKEDFNATKDIVVTDVERLHKLEQDRCDVSEELAEAKRRLLEAETAQKDSDVKYQQLMERYCEDTQALKAQVENLMFQINELDALNDEMHGELNEVQLLDPEHQAEQVEELQHHFSRSVEALRARVAKLETVESELVSSQAQVQQLQHQLRVYRQDSHFIGSMKDTIVQSESLQHQYQNLVEENASLRQDRANADLLRYQLQNMQQRFKEMEGVMEEVARLKIENSKLKAGGSSYQEGAMASLQIRLEELQQKEIVALSKYGELFSQFSVCQQQLKQCQTQLQETQKALSQEKTNIAAGNERINRLERRLIFVTKERDGCVNILNSYKLDSGVDGVMRELLAEKEQDIERSKERIAELESELEKNRLHKCSP